MAERGKHPLLGEKISPERYLKMWDDSSSTYGDAGVGGLRDRIIGYLFENDIIREGDSVLDVGCGPGTYSKVFAERCSAVTCLDSSQKMLDRIMEAGMSNIRCVKGDWESFDTDERFDVVFSSLCPALNRPDTLMKMESFSRRTCVYVSSMNDDSGSIRTEIWRKLGKDYTLNGYNTEYPFNHLREEGRNPELKVFEDIGPYEKSTEEVIEDEIRSISFYIDIDDSIRNIIVDTVIGRSVDGKVHFEGVKRLGLLIWGVQ